MCEAHPEAAGAQDDAMPAPSEPARPEELVLNPDRALPTALRSTEAYEGVTLGAQTNELGLVFTTLAGRPLDGPAANSTFKRLLKSADLRPLRLHDLRHGYASLLLAKGVHARVVMELLGHSQISLTLDTYSHVIPALQHEAVDRLDELLPMPIEDVFAVPPTIQP